MATGIEELVSTLYEMIQDAWAIPFGAEKCVIEREKALDILDEIRQSLPNDLKMARDIVEKRNELIAAGKRDADLIKKQAEEHARMLVSESQVTRDARRKANDMMSAAENQSRELKKVTTDYCEDILKRTEDSVFQALEEIKQSKQQFKALSQATLK